MLKFTIPLEPVSKKNSQRIGRRLNGKPIVLPSEAYCEYERNAGWHMPNTPTIDQPVNVKATFFCRTRRRGDLVNYQEALLDVLVKHRVLMDDNCRVVVSMDGSRMRYDPENPRTEVEITPAEDVEVWV